MFKWLSSLGQARSREADTRPRGQSPAGRMSLAEARAISHRYFALHEQIQAAQRARDYPQVGRLSRQTYQLLPDFVAACRREHGRWDIQSSVAVHTGGTILAVLQDEDGVRLLQQTLAAVEDLTPWRPVGDSAANDLKLVARIMGVVVAHPGVLQTALRDHLSDADGRRLATLAMWLEKAGRINRARSGKTWELSAVARNDGAAQDATAEPRPL